MKRKREDSFERLDTLAGALRENNLTPEESVELQELLESLPGAHRRFCEHMFLSSMLETELMSCQEARTGFRNLAQRSWKKVWFSLVDWRIGIGVAAALVAVGLVWIPLSRSPGEPATQGTAARPLVELLDHGVAVLTQIVGAKWKQDEQALKLGASLGRDT
jgi:hypothetical protein